MVAFGVLPWLAARHSATTSLAKIQNRMVVHHPLIRSINGSIVFFAFHPRLLAPVASAKIVKPPTPWRCDVLCMSMMSSYFDHWQQILQYRIVEIKWRPSSTSSLVDVQPPPQSICEDCCFKCTKIRPNLLLSFKLTRCLLWLLLFILHFRFSYGGEGVGRIIMINSLPLQVP